MKPALVFCLLISAAAVTAQTTGQPAAPPPLLPQQFAGWQLKGEVTKSADPVAADEANAPVVKEYGFQRLEKATYTRDDGRKLEIKAAAFDDASGAYGAFTYYKSPAMLNEKIGGQASSLNTRVLFYQGNILVDAVFDKLTVMSAAELRELAGVLPQPPPNARNLPPLPIYLPKESYEKNTAKYIMGPVTLDRVGSPLPSAMVDFKSGAEVVLGKYSVNAGDSTLMLISYPTPQIAIEKLRQIDAAHPVNPQPQSGAAPILDVGPFFDKRTGPIIVIAAGPLSQAEAKSLLSSINYEADVTWNENTFADKKNNLANLLFNVIVLCGIVLGLSLVAGLAFGGLRILLKRLFPNRVFDRPEDMEFISLHLGDQRRTGPGEPVSHSIEGS
ncbi:MAG: hypothetical protein LAO56_15240 [Acidobacteriia bacterium]|nr:hypothetical protein [Terriglobia bacterium]